MDETDGQGVVDLDEEIRQLSTRYEVYKLLLDNAQSWFRSGNSFYPLNCSELINCIAMNMKFLMCQVLCNVDSIA